MEDSKIITIKVDKELALLLDKVKKDYCINISALARKALVEELNSPDKYKGDKKNEI